MARRWPWVAKATPALKKKARNRQDATLVNVQATAKRVARLHRLVQALADRVTRLEGSSKIG